MRRAVLSLALLVGWLAGCASATQTPGEIALADSVKVNTSMERAVGYATRPTCGPVLVAACAKPAVRRELRLAAEKAAFADEAATAAARAQPIDTTKIGQTRAAAAQARAALDAILAREGVP